jgi:hypothetical protein
MQQQEQDRRAAAGPQGNPRATRAQCHNQTKEENALPSGEKKRKGNATNGGSKV